MRKWCETNMRDGKKHVWVKGINHCFDNSGVYWRSLCGHHEYARVQCRIAPLSQVVRTKCKTCERIEKKGSST